MLDPTNISCPKCLIRYKIDLDKLGKPLQCKCGHTFVAQKPKFKNTDRSQYYKELVQQYQKEVIKLKKKINENDEVLTVDLASSETLSIDGLDTFTLRLGEKMTIEYINSAFCKHLRVEREHILGKDISFLRKNMDQKVYTAILNYEEPKSITTYIEGTSGKSYELRMTSNAGSLEIVLQDVSNEEKFKKYVKRYVSTELASLSEKDLDTFKYPERRMMTVSFTDLRGFTSLSDQLTPEEVRSTMNAYLEEILHAVEVNQATVDKVVGDEVMALYGAPCYYKDHSLRAIKTCCEMMVNIKALQRSFSRFGKTMPDCSIGINTGEMVIGNMGSIHRQDYTVLGLSVNIAARLCGTAKGGQVIMTEDTLKAALRVLPDGWGCRAENDSEKASKLKIPTHKDALPLAEDLQGKVYVIGPVKDGKIDEEFRFEYLHAIKVKGLDKPIAIISAISPKKVSALRLEDHKIIRNLTGKIFGRFRLANRIGKGGMGEVWKATDHFGNLVALKMLLAGENASEDQLMRFKREAEVMSKLQHRGLCRIHEVGVVNGKSFIAMELIEGVTLSNVLNYKDKSLSSMSLQNLIKEIEESTSKKNLSKTKRIKKSLDSDDSESESQTLPLQQILSIMLKICDAVQYAHEHGILHRDLKPGNIMIRPDGEPVVMDFGLAKMEREEDGVEGMSLSISGQIMGTLEYMAPEQAKSLKEVTESADVFSLGAILYRMCTGEKYFITSGNVLSDISSLQDFSPIKPREIDRHIDPDLEIIILKALRGDSAERYPSVVSFMDDLQRFQRGEVISAKDVTFLEVFSKLIKRNKAMSAVIAASTTILITSAISSFIVINQQKNEAEQKTIEAESALASLHEERNERQQDQLSAAPRYYEKAIELLAKTKLNEALKNLEIAIEYDGKKNYFHNLKGIIHMVQEDYSKAQKEFSIILKQAPKNKSALRLNELNQSFVEEGNRPELSEKLGQMLIDFKRYHLAKLAVGNSDHLFEFYRKVIHSAWPQIRADRLTKNSKGELQFTLYKKIKDISVLRGIPIGVLDLRSSPTKDLSPLLGMPLRVLNLSLSSVVHIEDLSELPLKELNISSTSIKKITALKNLPLEKLTILNSRIEDFSPLEGLPLKKLSLQSKSVTNIDFLKGMPLETLSLRDLQIENVDALKGMPLKKLSLSSTKVKDINGLKGLGIEDLNLYRTQVENIDALKGMPLINLDLGGLSIQDLSPLQGAPLARLILSGFSIQQIDSLEGMPLKYLKLTGTRVSDLSPLKNCVSLDKLYLKNTPVEDLSALQNLPLTSLDLEGTQVSSLKAIENLTVLRELSILNSKVHDLRSISKLNSLTYLYLNPKQMNPGWDRVIKRMTTLKYLSDRSMGSGRDSPKRFLEKFGKINKNTPEKE